MKYLKVLFYPIIYIIIQMFIIFIFTLFYNNSIDASSFYIKTKEYQSHLSSFLQTNKILIE